MTEISDILLMRYADGDVDKQERLLVESYLAADPIGRQRLAAFSATGRTLADACADALMIPIPQRLIDAIDQAPMAVRQVPSPAIARPVVSIGRSIANLFGFANAPLMPVAFACAAALAVVGGAGYALRGQATPETAVASLLIQSGGRTEAGSWLAAALNKTMSGTTKNGDSGGQPVTMKPKLSFASTAKTLCRQFDVYAADGGFAAVGCKQPDGRWTIEAQLEMSRTAGSTSTIKPASGNGPFAIDSAVDRIIAGDVLTPALETEAIGRGWTAK